MANHARSAGDVAEEKKMLRAALAIDSDSLEPAARLLMLGIVTGDKKAQAGPKPRNSQIRLTRHPIRNRRTLDRIIPMKIPSCDGRARVPGWHGTANHDRSRLGLFRKRGEIDL